MMYFNVSNSAKLPIITFAFKSESSHIEGALLGEASHQSEEANGADLGNFMKFPCVSGV